MSITHRRPTHVTVRKSHSTLIVTHRRPTHDTVRKSHRTLTVNRLICDLSVFDKLNNFISRGKLRIVSEYDRDINNHHKLHTNPWLREKIHTTITRHQEDKLSKATSYLLPIKIIAKLEWTQSNAQQNIEHLQNPTMEETINNESTTT